MYWEKNCVCMSFKDNLLHYHVKVTTEAQLGLIGGTMGLLTGFSILSGVKIIIKNRDSFFVLSNSSGCDYLISLLNDNLSLIFLAQFFVQVEIIYYVFKLLMSLRVSRNMVSRANEIFENFWTRTD